MLIRHRGSMYRMVEAVEYRARPYRIRSRDLRCGIRSVGQGTAAHVSAQSTDEGVSVSTDALVWS